MLCILLWLSPSSPDIKYIRTLYHQAPTDEAKAHVLIRLLEENSTSSSTLRGYRGAVIMVMAKHTGNPYAKFRYFKRGKAVLEDAIANDRNNTELRYLRCTIQMSLPAFLEYNQHMEEDKVFLQKHVYTITDAQLNFMVVSFLNQQRDDKH